jgi:type II secretory pathway component HofQ
MNRKRRFPSALCAAAAGLILALVPPFVGSMHGQQADTAAPPPSAAGGAKTTLAEAVRKSVVHDRPIERFSVNNADLRSVFKQLSEFSGADIVLGDKVTGTVTLNVTNKTWREILGVVCKITGLTAIKEPSYLYIVPTEDYRKQQLTDQAMNKEEESLEELKRDVIQCNNAKAAEMMTSVQPLLSTRGKITLVERNNALIIFDTPDNIAQIRKTIQDLDIETNQVFISCKIIEVNSGIAKDLGIGWGYFDRLGGTDVSATHMPGFAVPGELERLTYGILGQDKLSATLSLLFQNTGAQIVAQPQITTLDNKEATVFLGSQIPIQTMTTAGGGAQGGQFVVGTPTITMVDAGTNLIVTPHVTSEKRIMLTLSSTKSSYTLTGTGTNPIINKQSAQTNVVVSDGETVVIAGLTSNETQTVDEGIPVLKDIPLLGNLFKHTKKTVNKDDLMIFVTPHIINKKVEAVSGVVK